MMPRTPLVIGIFAAVAIPTLLVGLYVLQMKSDTAPVGSPNEGVEIRQDGDDFAGFAVFPTWSTLEPATFPLLVDGQAQQAWFIDGMFPVEVRTMEGTLLGQGNAFAQNEVSDGVYSFYASVQAVQALPPYNGPAELLLIQAGSFERGAAAQFKTSIFVDTSNR